MAITRHYLINSKTQPAIVLRTTGSSEKVCSTSAADVDWTHPPAATQTTTSPIILSTPPPPSSSPIFLPLLPSFVQRVCCILLCFACKFPDSCYWQFLEPRVFLQPRQPSPAPSQSAFCASCSATNSLPTKPNHPPYVLLFSPTNIPHHLPPSQYCLTLLHRFDHWPGSFYTSS
jgi:hypothetical protein